MCGFKIAEKGWFFQSFFRYLFLYTAVVCKTHGLDKLMNTVGSLELEPRAPLKKKKARVFSLFEKTFQKQKQKRVKNKNPGRSLSSKKFLKKIWWDFGRRDETDLSGFRTWCWVVLGHFSGDNC